MNLLFYRTNFCTEEALLRAMQTMEVKAEVFTCPLQTAEQEEQFLPLIRQLIREKRAGAIFSFQYVRALSEACLAEGIFYLSFCCEAPALSVLADNLGNECNLIFTPDSGMIEEYRQRGAVHVFYLPLAPGLSGGAAGSSDGPGGFGMQAGTATGNAAEHLIEGQETCIKGQNLPGRPEISFAGSLHTECLYENLKQLPEMMVGFLDGVTAAQAQVYGYSLFADLINDSFLNTMMQVVKLAQAGDDADRYRYMIENYFLAVQTTRLERAAIAETLAEKYGKKFYLYSPELRDGAEIRDALEHGGKPGGFKLPPGLENAIKKISLESFQLYGEPLAAVYRNSAVNLCITNRARKTGIPLNAWDILSCGGFLLCNYQQDMPELLEPGRDFAMYGSMRELLQLTEYYLSHPAERMEIAANGSRKVRSEHTWEVRVREMLSYLQ